MRYIVILFITVYSIFLSGCGDAQSEDNGIIPKPQNEVEVEINRFFASRLKQDGDSVLFVYTKQDNPVPGIVEPTVFWKVFLEVRNLEIITKLKKLSEADKLNGIEKSAIFAGRWAAYRKRNFDRKGNLKEKWSKWQTGGQLVIKGSAIKKDGKWNINLRTGSSEYIMERL